MTARSYDEYVTHCPECEGCLTEDDHKRITGCLKDVERALEAVVEMIDETQQIAPHAQTGANTTPKRALDPLSWAVEFVDDHIELVRERLRPCGDDAHVTCRPCLRRLKAEAGI